MQLQERLAAGEMLIMDGAMGTELERRGVPMHGVAWAGAAVLTHPDAVRQVHEEYVRAGAEILITNTFASGRAVLAGAGLGDQVAAVNRQAARLALEARDRAGAGRDIWVAGSISPMAPGIDASRLPPPNRMGEYFREQAEVLVDAGVDLLVLEMMRDLDYCLAAIEAAAASRVPVWVGLSCRRREDGELVAYPVIKKEIPLRDVVAAVAAAPGVDLIAVMHSEVQDTGPALEVVKERWSGPLGAYPNSGYFQMPHWQFVDIISPADLLAAAKKWVGAGAQVVGGCCGIGPEHIRVLADGLQRRTPQS